MYSCLSALDLARVQIPCSLGLVEQDGFLGSLFRLIKISSASMVPARVRRIEGQQIGRDAQFGLSIPLCCVAQSRPR